MKLTFVIFNMTVMVVVLAQFFMHQGPFTKGSAAAAIFIGVLAGAVVAGIAYVTVGKNAE
jgi:hypothetical protein